MGTDSKAKIIGNKEDLECKSYLETINFKTKQKKMKRGKNTSERIHQYEKENYHITQSIGSTDMETRRVHNWDESKP